MLLTVTQLLQCCSECSHNSTSEDGTLEWTEHSCLEIIQIIEQTDFRKRSAGVDYIHILFRSGKTFFTLGIYLGALLQMAVDFT